ncbi:signal peptide peptidase SppA [Lewinella sp. W8]|uniref:signal peptide peptidase SppA n=1 Tax=Lewinella sp. W8 TaxID=2528208 RepID=UPI0010686AE9|nr:signal peptide peptidase SppA [Lewinella sp. W8]MTB49496.1 signal peptide peptidase SppA [Lewinella sp. W8]
MSNFFKILFGSCLGTLLALGALFFIGISTIAGLAASTEEKPRVSANSILEIDLVSVPELSGNQPLDSPLAGGFDTDEVLGLHDLIRAIENAKDDDDIKGIYLNNSFNAIPFTSLRLLREAVADFRTSGKFVLSYAPYYEQKAYYLASAGDEVFMGPLGAVDFRGLGAEIPFFKGALDKVGVKMEVFWAGDYKSATEPFRRTSMSDASREQTKEYLEDLFGVMLDDLSAGRNIPAGELREMAGALTGWKGQAAVDAGLVDGIKRRTEIDRRLHELVGFDPDEKLNTIEVDDYFAARMKKLKGGGDSEVAVLIAEGTIVDGKGDLGSIGDHKYVKELEKFIDDDDVKAVVLRVNSGGGSASSSENIWYAVEQLKEAGKPVVVSMGDYAASGGYYIAAGADSIFAEPSTITGSIGVFMMFPNMKELMNDKLGITFDTVNTARNATAFSTFRDMGPEEREILKARTENIYDIFLSRVAEGRDIPVERVREIAGGRVYSGMRAEELGLVDRLAGLEEAIESAANMANLDNDYSIGHYPKIKPPLEQLLEELFGQEFTPAVTEGVVKQQLGPENYEYYRMMRDLTNAEGAQARLPLMLRF